MEEFIKLIEDIGFVKDESKIVSTGTVQLVQSDYSYNEYFIFIIDESHSYLGNNRWSMSKIDVHGLKQCVLKNYNYGLKIDNYYELKTKTEFNFNEIDLLKEHFISYFRDIKIKELGI